MLPVQQTRAHPKFHLAVISVNLEIIKKLRPVEMKKNLRGLTVYCAPYHAGHFGWPTKIFF